SVRDSTDDATTLAAINQLLSLFSQSLDNKDFEALRDVYTEDAVLGGQGAPPTIGIEAILDFYTTTFQNESLVTVHTSDTVLRSNCTETTASSSSYANVYYLGPAVFERGGALFRNSSVQFREKLANDYTRSADGHWKISRQELEIL
ncbi:MAG: hypothetical protein L6R42_010774, partial [Xanthoria sp. 1 TBL-2021]